MGNINASLFISKDTYNVTHPHLPSFDEGNKKLTHLIYYSAQPNKISSFPFSTLRNIFSKPNFFYKNHNHYFLLPPSSPYIYQAALESALLNLCTNILQYVKSSMQNKIISRSNCIGTISETSSDIYNPPSSPILASPSTPPSQHDRMNQPHYSPTIRNISSTTPTLNDLSKTQTTESTPTEMSPCVNNNSQTQNGTTFLSLGNIIRTQTSNTQTSNIDINAANQQNAQASDSQLTPAILR